MRLFYLLQSRALTVKLNRTLNLSIISRNIGRLYFEKKDYTNAVVNYDKAIAISEKIKDTMRIAMDYLNLREAQYKLGELEVVKMTLSHSMDLLGELDMELASSHLNYALVLFELKEIESSKVEVIRVLEIAKKENDIMYYQISPIII